MLSHAIFSVTQYYVTLGFPANTPSTQMLTFPVDREKDFSIYFTNERGKKVTPNISIWRGMFKV